MRTPADYFILPCLPLSHSPPPEFCRGLSISSCLICCVIKPQLTTQILRRALHRAGGADQVAAVGRPGGQVLVDDHAAVAERVLAGTQSRTANRVRHDERAVEAAAFEIIPKGDKWHVHAIGDKTDLKTIRQAQYPLNDVIVPRQQHRAAVAKMGEQRQAGVDAGAQLVKRRIAMAGGNADALFRQDNLSLAPRRLARAPA